MTWKACFSLFLSLFSPENSSARRSLPFAPRVWHRLSFRASIRTRVPNDESPVAGATCFDRFSKRVSRGTTFAIRGNSNAIIIPFFATASRPALRDCCKIFISRNRRNVSVERSRSFYDSHVLRLAGRFYVLSRICDYDEQDNSLLR